MTENNNNIGTVSSSDDSSATRIHVVNGNSNYPDQAKVRITVDLVTAARRHLSFLKALSDSTVLHHAPTIHRSIRRYEDLWMPLVSERSKGSSAVLMLSPPVDVQWVWHCHCLSPARYREYCASRFGHQVDRPAIFDDENEDYASNRCRDIWTARYPSEPFDLDAAPDVDDVDDGAGGITSISSTSEGDLFAMVTKHRDLYSNFSDPYVAETVYLISARHRYKCFLHLSREFADEGRRMVPTSDILLMWLTHQSFPGVYTRDLEGMEMADLERRIVGFGYRTEEGEVEETKGIWEKASGEPYERAGAGFEPANSASRVFFYWEGSDDGLSDANRTYKAPQPRFLMEVCIFLEGKWEGLEAKNTRKTFLRLRTVRCHREMKLDKSISDLSSTSWRKTWHLCCEFGTRGIILELRRQRSNCLRNSKLIKSLVFLWNDLLRATSLTLTKDLEMQVKAMASVTPPVQAPCLLKCVPDRVTDDKGHMISDVILRMNNYHPQEGRWLSRTVLDHAGRECFVMRIRVGEGFWRRGAETPRAVKWEDRIIEVREGPWSYVASSVGTTPQKVVGTATPKEEDLRGKKVMWCLSTGDVLTITWERGLDFQLENKNTNESMRLLRGRKLHYSVKDVSSGNKDYEQEEEQFVTLVRFVPENPNGRATALLNWRLLAVELLPEEDAILVLLLCMAILRTISSEIRREDVGRLLVRRRVKEAELGSRDWGSVVLPPSSTASSPHLKPWFWNNAGEVLASAVDMADASHPTNRYSPADGKDVLYK